MKTERDGILLVEGEGKKICARRRQEERRRVGGDEDLHRLDIVEQVNPVGNVCGRIAICAGNRIGGCLSPYFQFIREPIGLP